MKHWNKILLSALTAAMLLALPACGKDEATPVCPVLHTGGIAQDEGDESVLAATMQTPTMRIHYIDEGADCSAALTPASDYIYKDSKGNSTLSQSTRPCKKENICTVYSADPTGEVRLALYEQLMLGLSDYEFIAAANLPSLTVMAYPATEDGTVELASDSATRQLPVIDGRFTMLRGWYYYEVTFTSEDGVMMYGFIGYRTDEYEYSETVSGCCVEIYEEDPDARIKHVPTLTLSRPYGENGRVGSILFPHGEASWSYINEAGTEVTRTVSTASVYGEDNTRWFTAKDLVHEFEIELSGALANGSYGAVDPGLVEDPQDLIEKITVTRYPLDEMTAAESFVLDGNKITFQEESRYEIQITFINGYATYELMTGTNTAKTSHPSDDPNMDPETAKQMRADYRTLMLQTGGTSASSDFTIDSIYVETYYGTFNNIPVVSMGSNLAPAEIVREVEIGKYTIYFPSSRMVYTYFNSFHFDTLADAYEKKHLTDEDIYKLGCMIDSTFASRYPTP